MQQARSQNRAPGSFSPLTSTSNSSSRPPPIKTNGAPRASFSSDEATTPTPTLSRPRSRNPGSSPGLSPAGLSPATAIAPPGASASSSRTTSPNVYQSAIFAGSSSSLANSARAHPSSPATAAAIAARGVGGGGPTSPLTTSTSSTSPSIASTTTTTSSSSPKGHHRKHSQTPGLFEPTLPSTSTSNLQQHQQHQHHHQQQQQQQPQPPQHPLHQHHNSSNVAANPNPTALAAAAQAAMQHQNQHLRQRSQTVPMPGTDTLSAPYEKQRGASTSGGKGPLSPPMLSLTEASAPRESGFGNQAYHNGLMGNHTAAATTAANVVFQRPNLGGGAGGAQASPALPSQTSAPAQLMSDREKIVEVKTKPEKSRKLFGRPSKISVKGDIKDKPQPSPSKIGAAFSSLQRGNFSTSSLVDPSAPSLYTLANSSSATIRAVDSPVEGLREGGKDASLMMPTTAATTATKEKKHHFLSRGKHKLSSNKDSDYHSILSSSSSNSKPTDPHAPSIYNFNVPSSPGPTTTSFKSSLDLRHGGRRDKKAKEDKLAAADGRDYDTASIHTGASEWPGPSSLTSLSSGVPQPSMYLPEPLDPGKFGLNNMTMDDAWPYLKAKLLVIFQGEDLRLPVEDFNRVVTMHIQYCVQRRAPHIILEDLKDLLTTGFSSLDQALRTTSEDRLIPDLVELWLFTFTGILPYMQAVFLPLDLEFSGNGTILSPEQAREFWGGVTTSMASGGSISPTDRWHGHGHRTSSSSSTTTAAAAAAAAAAATTMTPLSNVLDVRRLVLAAYRDAVILPRYDTLRQIFSRLSLEFLPMALQSPPPGPIPIAGGNINNPYASAGSSFVDGGGNPLSTSPAGSEPAGLTMMGSMVQNLHGGQQHQQHSGSFSSSVGVGPQRPGTAMSLDPSLASYNSTGTTLLGEGGNPTVGMGAGAGPGGPSGLSQIMMSAAGTIPGGGGAGGIAGGGGYDSVVGRSRAISNVSFGSNLSAERPFTPGGTSSNMVSNNQNNPNASTGSGSGSIGTGAGPRDNVEDSKQVTEMVGRVLQCMSVLAGVGVGGGEDGGEEGNARIGELCRLLKLNWLGRGRTGRNRRGIVGGRVRRGGAGAGGGDLQGLGPLALEALRVA